MTAQSKLICLLIAAAALACGQETRGTIFGRVLDPQNAAVVGAAVTVTNVDTNAATRLRSNETGYFEANLLIPGNYQVTAETISVTSEAPLVDVSSVSAGRVMENRSVTDLPTFNNSR